MACFMGWPGLHSKSYLNIWMCVGVQNAVCPEWNLRGDSDFCRLGNSLFRGDGRLHFRSENLKVAAFFQTGAHGSDLATLFHDERGATLRARFRDGHVRSSEITIGVTRTTIEN